MMNDRKATLEQFLRQTHADQGGEAPFDDFSEAVAADDEEYGHAEAVEYLAFRAA